MRSVGKIVHSLRFQLPAVVVGVFVGMLFLLMLFFHEMGKILVKTRQLAHSAEINDMVVNWNAGLSACARERTKLMSLGNESYLRSLQVSLDDINGLYAGTMRSVPDTLAKSTRELEALHAKQVEYMELLDGFSKEQGQRRLARAAEALPQAPASAEDPSSAASASGSNPAKADGPAGAAKSAKAAKLAKTGKAGKAGKLAKAGNAGKARGAAKPAKGRLAAKPKPGAKAAAAGSRRLASAEASAAKAAEQAKEIDLDSMTNETFKAYEADLREGLILVQETLRSERREKLASLRDSVGRAKDRLIYSLLLLLAMVGYVAVILKWKILDPMKVLKEGAVEIGRGSLGHQVSVKSRNEMGELAEVFNRMSVQLEHKQNSELKVKRLEAIEQIVRSVNHEINNPLMIISGNAEYLLAVLDPQSEDVKSKLGSIVNESRRIFTVTQRLKEIKEPVTENYIGDRDQMIDILRSSQIRQRDF